MQIDHEELKTLVDTAIDAIENIHGELNKQAVLKTFKLMKEYLEK